jgi:AAA ATPase domain
VPRHLTILRVDLDAAHAGPMRAAARELEGIAGEPEVVATPDRSAATLVVAFHLAADAVAAVEQLIDAVPSSAVPRAALATGELEVTQGRHEGPARERADALAAAAGEAGSIAGTGEATVLVSASTAVMVTHALAPGRELVAVATSGDERAYLLRAPGPGPLAVDDDAAASNLGWAHRAAAHRVVGRPGPLARLEGAWAAALEGDHRVVVLSGDPGIGKTTLAAEQALRVHAGGGMVLYGRWDEEALAPYQAIREAMGSYAAACPRRLLQRDVEPHADDLARLLPDIGARIGGVRPPLADDPDAERMRLFDAVRHWLGAVARRRPVLLVLDDLQWAERSSLRLLRHIVDNPPDGPMLLVLTLRDGEVEGMGPLHALGSFEDSPEVDRVEVPGLDVTAVVELIAQVMGQPADEWDAGEAAQWLTEQTAGNPFLVQEILRGLDPGEPVAALLAARRRLPDRVHDVVRWRLARLDPETNETLAAASVVGERFSLDVLAATLGCGVIDLRHRLDDAARAGVVRDTDDGQGLAFAHTVVRRALQDEVPPERAAELHRRIARALSEGPGHRGSPAEIAHHHLQAADAETAEVAIRWARTAADQARRETAFEGAVWFLSRGVDVHDRFGDPAGAGREVGCELRLDLADAHDRAGEFIARDRRHLEAADLARELDRTDLFTRAALGYGGRLPASPPNNPVARRLLDEALVRLSERDSRARALALARLAHVLHAVAPHDDRRAISDEAEAMARRLEAPVVVASVLVSRVLALDGPDDVDDHLEIGAEVIRIGEQTGDSDLVLQGARARIHPLFVVGAHDAARDLAARFTDLAGKVRHPDHLRLAAMWQIMWAALAGNFGEAERMADALRLRLEVAGHSQVAQIHFMETFVLRWMQGRLAETRPMVTALLAQMPESLTWWVLGAWAEAGAGDVDGALSRLADRSTADLLSVDAGYQWQTAVAGTALCASTVGDRRWAEVAHDLLAPYGGRNMVFGYVAYLGAVDHHLGTLASVLGRHDEAVIHLEAALERHRVIAARPWVALSAAWLANALIERDRRGDAARADTLLAEATDLAAALGLHALPPPHPKLR